MDNLKDHIARLREDFTKDTLLESNVKSDPAAQFHLWLEQAVAAQVPEVQAMNLCTVSREGKPSSRIVYMREFGHNTFSFYTNYLSKKSKQLENNPHASLVFFWPELERQIRIEGVVEKAPKEQSDAYFNARPYESKIGAWASGQSSVLASRKMLEDKVEELKKQMDPQNIERPEFWGGFVLKANYYEFWQGRKSRLHDRISYTATKNGWGVSRLAP